MKNLYTIILCFLFFSLQAQDYYYNGSERININKSENSFISFDTSNKMKSIANGFEKVKTFTVEESLLCLRKTNGIHSLAPSGEQGNINSKKFIIK